MAREAARLRRFGLSGALLAALLLCWAAPTLAAATDWVGDRHAAARLITATDAVGAAKSLEAGLEIRLAPGWHAYWRTPGDAGIPPSVDWAGSGNLTRADLAWPAPARYSLQGFETAGYRDRVVLPVALALQRPGERLVLHALVNWAACANICVPYSTKLDLALPAGPATPSPQAALIAAARAQVPQPLAAADIELVSANIAGASGRDARLVLVLRSHGEPFSNPDLFVEGLDKGSPGRPAAALSQNGQRVRLQVPIRDAAAAAIAGKPLTLTLVDGPRAAEFTATPRSGAPPGDAMRLLPILAIALLGGLVLNAMPCVLPVLSLKLLSLASQAGVERRRVRMGLLLTALGVVASFLVIAAVLIALKASGAAIGWGIQFQWPWFIAAMAVVTALFAASLWGWLPILLPRSAYEAADVHARSPGVDAFLTGVFATLLATPCSAPFVGTAVGFALTQGPAEIAAIFAALGVGMAAPYLAAVALPGFVRLLPRPGRWMIRLRVVLGFALAGTAIWLLFVLAALSGAPVAVGAAAALATMLGLLKLRSRGAFRGGRARLAASAIAALAAAAVLGPAFAGIAAPVAAPAGRWQAFDPGEINHLVGQGKTVFVDVTAAWCLTCKVNEAAVLDRQPVAGRLFGAQVVAMRGDWTRPDPALTRYLASFGRYGIPFNAVYGPSRPEGELLPELLTPGAVEQALDRAGAPG